MERRFLGVGWQRSRILENAGGQARCASPSINNQTKIKQTTNKQRALCGFNYQMHMRCDMIAVQMKAASRGVVRASRLA
jgi:hypothetical protein